MVRILHVWDQAGTASIIAKWQRKQGDTAHVIKNSKHDKTGITSFYGGQIVGNKYVFVLKAVLAARNYDIIHCHDAWFMVVPIKMIYPNKKIIMHYHGSMVRANLKGGQRLKWEKFCDAIIVATPDLLDFEYSKRPTYIPNPVDTDLFYRRIPQKNNTAFTSLKRNSAGRQVQTLLYDNGINVKLESQTNTKGYAHSVPYKDFADKIAKYEYYADIPIIDGQIIPANSMCGLQAMFMGIKVICHDFTIRDSLPSQHKPENVVREIDGMYAKVLSM